MQAGGQAGAATAKLPPQHILVYVAVAGLAILALLSYINLQIPWLGLQLTSSEDAISVTAVAPLHPNAGRIHEGSRLRAIRLNSGALFSLGSDDLIAEPDVLIEEGAYEAFMSRQDRIFSAYADGHLEVVLADGKSIELRAVERPLAAIPWMFWLELAFCLTCLLVGAAVWAFQRNEASAYFFASGVGFFICVGGEAMYGTRELALPSELFLTVSFMNSAGALMITAALISLMWVYPRRLGGRWMPMTAAVAGLSTLAESRLHIIGAGLWILQVYIAGCLVLGTAMGATQWLGSRNDPVARAIARWIVSVIFLGSTLFAVIIVFPVLFGTRHLASQGPMFGAFLIIYLGVAVGVARYRVFDLDLWWFKAWGWFLGGLTVLALDAVLLLVFNLGDVLSLSISLAIVGWLYFPVRQWLWQRFMRTGQSPLELALPELVDALFAADSVQAVRNRWPDLLRQIFTPLAVESCHPSPGRVEIIEGGTQLHFPPLENGEGIKVIHPAGGSRLFNREDIRLAELVHALMRRAILAVRAREAGEVAERGRIRRDLHDDLGAQLLDMAHTVRDGADREKVREAMGSLRSILTSMGEEYTALAQVLRDWRLETESRLSDAGIECEWHNEVKDDWQLNARQRANLGRVLREITSNIIRHSGAGRACYRFSGREGIMHVEIGDNGRGMQPGATGSGLGMTTMQERLKELGGSIDITADNHWPTLIRLQISISGNE